MIGKAIAFLGISVAGGVYAQEAGTWRLGAGLHYEVADDSGSEFTQRDLQIENVTKGSISGDYWVTDNISVGADFALPVTLEGGSASTGRVWATDSYSLTLMGRYYFDIGNASRIKPYGGAGLTYTVFGSEEADGPFSGMRFRAENDLALAVAAGFEIPAGNKAAIRTELRYNGAEGDLSLNGQDAGVMKLNPLTLGLSYLYAF